MRKKKPKLPSNFKIPESFLDTLYEMTGGSDKHKGYFLFCIDENGKNQIKSKFDSEASEFSVIKCIELFIINYTNMHEINFAQSLELDQNDEEDD